MKQIAVVLMLALVVVFILLNRTEQPKVSEVIQPQSPPQEVPKRFRQLPANVARHPQQGGELDPCLQLLGEPVPAGAQPYLVRAVKSAQMIEKEKRTFAKNTNGNRLLEGLQRKLFIDDYNYAALATGQLDSKNAAATYDKLAEGLSRLEDVPAQIPADEFLPPDRQTAQRMKQHYQPILENPNPGYSNVWSVLSTFSPDPLSTDLFKDTLAYVVLQTEMKERMDEEIKDRQTMLARLTDHIKDIALAAKASSNYEIVSQDAVAQAMLLQGAYHNVFAFRFTSSHALEADPLIRELDKLTLTGAGPELVIPPR